ncbi:MAG: alkaline phosphatase family protein [Ilumatobacter sp.]|nr:alkaline phosphatase family protein [Ilumatobacter sp.]
MATGEDSANDQLMMPELQVDRSPSRLRHVRTAGFMAAAAAVAFMWLDDRAGWLDYQPGGTAFFTYVRPVFYGMFLVGSVVAIKWEIAGGAIGAFAAGAIGAIVVNQLVTADALIVIALLAVPAALWVLADLLAWTRRTAAIGFAVAIAAVAAGVGTGEYVYERSFGPTHPASSVEPLPDSLVRWVWSGAVTATGAEIVTRTERDDVDELRLALVTGDASFDSAPRFVPVARRDGELASFIVDELEADTRYRYAVEVDGRLDTVRTGAFTTFPTGPASFTFTVGSCARVGSNGAVFDAVRSEEPLVHLIAGDFHYGDIPDDERDRYDEVIDLTLRQPAQSALYRSTPIAYMWDDHDYGVNDSSASSASRLAAMDAYRANVPSYPLADPLSPVYQRFDVGRVRFLLTDARSGREDGVTMLGDDQLAWLLDELVVAADEQALVVWLNPVPWVADAEPGADSWAGYADERQLIADTIARHEIDNLLMVSGDAHMVAIDDGSNTDFSSTGGAGFPLIHAAALDRPGSTKGGPYSHGAVGGGGQYAVVEVTDDGGEIRVALRAKRWDGEIVLAYDFTVPSD